MIPTGRHLHIGAFLFEDVDQMDFTGPFEVLSRLPDSTFHIFGKTAQPVRDARGLVLTPATGFAGVPELDVLIVPGGSGVNRLMEDEETLDFLRRKSAGLECLFSVCTGALLLGAAGLLKGRRATTHWASHDLLASFGTLPVDGRVVVDGNLVTAAGVTSGIDAALRVAALLRGDAVAQGLQLYLEYTPDPPFHSGSPQTSPVEVTARLREQMRDVLAERHEIARRVAARLASQSARQ
jgi:cyclohexyl-isocyanide hydratase